MNFYYSFPGIFGGIWQKITVGKFCFESIILTLFTKVVIKFQSTFPIDKRKWERHLLKGKERIVSALHSFCHYERFLAFFLNYDKVAPFKVTFCFKKRLCSKLDISYVVRNWFLGVEGSEIIMSNEMSYLSAHLKDV